MTFSKRALVYAAGAAIVAVLLVWWAWPSPRVVEIAHVTRGAVQESIEEDGETRAVDRFGIAAPVAGRLLRVALREGDPVTAGQVVAEIAPLPIAAADREMLEAKLDGARALRLAAEERVRAAQTDAAQAERERLRVADLVARKFMSVQALEEAQVGAKTKSAQLEAARSNAAAAAADIEAARAMLTAVRTKAPMLRVTSPVSGSVLRVAEKSERVIPSGTVLVTVGDPHALEIVVDVLSNDAVRVKPGMRMLITGWGGKDAIEATVRLVEPAAFKKISALGVEEQRVNVIADFRRVPPGMGDAYRVDARIIVAERADALRVPVGALFRRNGQWTVFVLAAGRLAARGVEVGLRGARDAEIVSGLSEGDIVVLYPGNDLAEGVRAVARK